MPIDLVIDMTLKGASIATLDAMMLKEKLDPSVQVTTTVFGLPRVGNQEWADFVDATVRVPILSFHASVPQLLA